MTHTNQVPHLTQRAKAARRRERLASFILLLVVVGCIAVTVLARFNR